MSFKKSSPKIGDYIKLAFYGKEKKEMPNHNILWLGIFLLIFCFLWYSPFFKVYLLTSLNAVFSWERRITSSALAFILAIIFLSKSKKESNETPYKVESAFNANNEGSDLPNSYLA